ncbi:MAG: exodeoxyribonuclease V subunit alpha [Pseudonocardia sp.]
MTATVPARAADPFDHRLALRASGLLAAFNAAGVLHAADVHVATRLGRLGDETDERVLLAVGLAVRGIRTGSVCVELATLHRTVLGESDDPAAVAALPWPEPTCWAAACTAGSLVADGPDAPPGRPARLVGGLLYLERYWRQEEQVRRELEARAGAVGRDGYDVARVRAALERHFPAPVDGDGARRADLPNRTAEGAPADSSPGTVDGDADVRAAASRQRLAAAVGVLRRVSVLAGGPGTGKTTTVARLLAVLAASRPEGRPPVRIALAAPTGKAAARLEEAVHEHIGALAAEERALLGTLHASTLHRLLGLVPGAPHLGYDAANRLPHDVVVVDETSMVSLPLMARLLDALRPDARLVLVGDPDQLASVEAGAVLGDLTRATGAPEPALATALAELGADGGADVVNGVVTLRHTYRFGGAIAALARAIQAGDADTALAVLRSGDAGRGDTGGAGSVEFVECPDGPAESVALPAPVRADVDATAHRRAEAALAGDAAVALDALDAHRVLCGHRQGPYGAAWWGAEIERRLVAAGRPVAPAPGEAWYPGRPVLVTTNDPDTGLSNGDTGVVLRTAEGVRVAFGRGRGPVLVSPARLADVQTVHAMTVHRAQGSQFAAVTVVVPPAESPLLTRELLYTAVTRARRRVRVVGSEAAIRAAVERPVSRASGLRLRLGRRPAAVAAGQAAPEPGPG